MPLPRYFVPRPGAVAEERPLGRVAFPLDVFAIEPAAAPPEEWLIGMDDGGALTLQRTAPESDLLPLVREAVAFNEVSKGDIRALAQESLHALEVSSFEGTPEVPGVDDPVYLYGALVGPLAPGCRQARRIEGKLAITRGDLLQGLVSGAAYSFLHLDRVTERTAQTLHMLLPGDRTEVLAAGRGAVIAYPVCGPDTEEVGPGNEALVTEMLQELIAALSPAKKPARHPVAGKLEDFLGRARETLSRFPDWPDPRTRALLARVRPRITPPSAAAAPRPLPPAPTPPAPAPVAPVAPDWLDRLNDKYDARSREDSKQVSSLARLVQEATARQRAPKRGPAASPVRLDDDPTVRPFDRISVEGSIVTAWLSNDIFRPSADVSLYIQASLGATPEHKALVETMVRTLGESLAAKDRHGSIRTAYWACGPQGMEVEPAALLHEESARLFRLRSPRENEKSARLALAIHDFVLDLRYPPSDPLGVRSPPSDLRGACAIFLADDTIVDVGEAAAFSAGLSEAIARGELPRLGFVLVSPFEELTDRLTRIVSRIRGKDPWPLWQSRTADEARLVPDLIAALIDRVTDGGVGATILDDHGNVLRRYPGRPPRILTFAIPARSREFVLAIGERRFLERIP